MALFSVLLMASGCTEGPGSAIEPGANPANELDAIIQGVPARATDPGQKSVVLILGPQLPLTNQNPKPDFLTCTGVLIADNIVLTAAHCVKPLENKVSLFHDQLIPDLGLVGFAGAPGEQRRITRFLVHEQFHGQTWEKEAKGYRPYAPFDVALISFAGSRPTGTRIADIFPSGPESIVRKSLRLYGYGYSDVGDTQIAERTRAIEKGREDFLQHISLLTTNRRARLSTKYNYGFLLDQRGRSGICYGDSGGPAFVTVNGKSYVAGINSHRTGLYRDAEGKEPLEKITNECQYESVLTRPAAYATWIIAGVELLKTNECEDLPFIRERAADIFRMVERTMLLAPSSKNSLLFRIKGEQSATGRRQKSVTREFAFHMGTECRIPSGQGLVTVRTSHEIQSPALRETQIAIQKVAVTPAFAEITLTDRLETFSESSAAFVLPSVAAQEGWQLPSDGWQFETILRNQDGSFTTSEGSEPLASLNLEQTTASEALQTALSKGLDIYWSVSTDRTHAHFRQELWIRDATTHETLILRQTVASE